MFPEFLHGGVHYQQGVVGEVDGYLALEVGILGFFIGLLLFGGTRFGRIVFIFAWDDPPHSEFASDAERDRADDSTRSEVC